MRIRASNVCVNALTPSAAAGEPEHILLIGDEYFTLEIVGDPRNMRAIAMAINDRLNRLDEEVPA